MVYQLVASSCVWLSASLTRGDAEHTDSQGTNVVMQNCLPQVQSWDLQSSDACLGIENTKDVYVKKKSCLYEKRKTKEETEERKERIKQKGSH